jgi:SulP family sulfate permease
MSLPVTLHRFRPRLLEALAVYDRRQFIADLGAGLTVGVVALPVAMAFAIASGVKPEQGLFTAIIAGFLISRSAAPTCRSVARRRLHRHRLRHRRAYGVANLMIATSLAGVLLFVMGLLRWARWCATSRSAS